MSIYRFSAVQELVESLSVELERLSHGPELVNIALSGGSTPKAWFIYLAESDYRSRINWSNLHFWWVDERFVPHSDEQSNFGEAVRLLWSQLTIPEANLHPVEYGDEIDNEVERYSQEICAALTGSVGPDIAELVFDWVLLGVGEDGHTASLFPGQTDYECGDSVIACHHPETRQPRISLSAGVISAARRISYVITGKSKSEILGLTGPNSSPDPKLPASMIRSATGLTDWFIDNDAASGL